MDEMNDSSDDEPGPTARMPTDELMNSEVAILAGGRDQQGRQLITFPARHHGILESKVKAIGVGRILRYFIDSSRKSDKRRGFGYVADLRFATIDFVSMLKSMLSSLQAEMRDSIGTCILYAIQPICKKTRKDTLTLMTLRKSKKKQNKHITPPLFQVLMAADEMDLYNYIDRSHLTPDLGGYLQYSHNAWLRFRKAVDPFFFNYESLQVHLPTGYERLIHLSHQHAQDNSKEELQQLLHWLREQYEDIMRDVNIESVTQLCESLQTRFDHSENDPVFGPMAQKPVFRETKSILAHCYQELTLADKKLNALWKGASCKVQQTIDLMTFTEQVKLLQDWFAEKGWKQLKRRIEIADSVSRAEMLCNHFNTGLHSKAKAKLAQADGLIQHAESMVVEHRNHNILHIMKAVKQLKQEIHELRAALNKRKTTLQMVYDFFFVYEKAAKWVTRVLKFLPDNLIDLFSDLQVQKRKGQSHGGTKAYQWHDEVRHFLHRYPPPNREELAKARQSAEVIPENKAKKQGRILVHRCLVLLRILNIKEVASMRDVVETVKWKEALLSDKTEDSVTEKQHRKVPTSDSSLTSPDGNNIRSPPLPSKGKVRDEFPERSKRQEMDVADSKSQKKTGNDRLPEDEALLNGVNEQDHATDSLMAQNTNHSVKDFYCQSSITETHRQGLAQRPMYLPGGTGHETHAIRSHVRQNGGAPATQELHNQSFGNHCESNLGADFSNGYGSTNDPNLYLIGLIPQGLPANLLPGNRYTHGQEYSMPPPKVSGRPTTSSPNSYSLSPTDVPLSGEPSPIQAPYVSLNGTQQSQPLRPYKSMVDVHQVGTDVNGPITYPPNLESTPLYRDIDPVRSSMSDNSWRLTLPGLQHGKSEPRLNQVHQPVTSPYSAILENLSSMRLQASSSDHERVISNEYESKFSYKMPRTQITPQEQYYQRLFGTDSSNLEKLSSEHFNDRSPYDISVSTQRLPRLQKQQRARLQSRTFTGLPPPKIPVDKQSLPEKLTSLDILEYELAADQQYLAEEIADDEYRMEKEHQAMIESLLKTDDLDGLHDNPTRPYNLGDLHTNSCQDKKSAIDGITTRSPNPTSQDPPTNVLLSEPSTPTLPATLASPPNDDWSVYSLGSHGASPGTPLTMAELYDLDDTGVPSGYGIDTSAPNGHSLTPLTDGLKEYFQDSEQHDPVHYERMLEAAQRSREESQEVLRREIDRYNDVLMHREDLIQVDLQDRLNKIEEKLQEEEAILKQEAELDYLMEIEKRHDYASPKHTHNYDLSQFEHGRDLHLSDEGVIFDGGSVDEAYEHASNATTERESVESGLGLRRIVGLQGTKEKLDSKVSTVIPQTKHSSTVDTSNPK